MNRFIIMASLLFVALSCNKVSEEQLAEPNNDAQIVTLTASLTDAATRVLASTDSDSGWTFTWEADDKISGWYSDCSGVTEFVTETHNLQSSTFTGTVVADKSYRFIYPSQVESVSGNICTIDISDQTGGRELDKSYLVNDAPIESQDIISGTVSDLSMKHVGAFMAVDVYIENFVKGSTYRLEGVKYSSDDDVICNYAEIDMTKEVDEDGFYYKTMAGAITADMNVEFEAVGDGSQYRQAVTRLNILPSTVGAGETATIELTIGVYDSKEDDATLVETLTPSVTIQNTSEAELPLARATHNFTYLLVDGTYGVEITGATINDWGDVVDSGDMGTAKISYFASEISADMIPEADIWIISDSGEITYTLMAGVRAALDAASEAGRTITLSIPNATSIGEAAFSYSDNLSSIELGKVTTIGNYAFRGCFLTSFDFTGVTSIGDTAFAGNMFATIELPSTVTYVGEFALVSEYTTTIILHWTGDEIIAYDYSTWGFILSEIDLYIPSGTTADYAAKGWTGLKSVTEMAE